MPTFYIDKENNSERIEKIMLGVVNKVTKIQRDLDFTNAKMRVLGDRINWLEDMLKNTIDCS